MVVRAVIFDRDGVLTYFDTAAIGVFVEPYVPLSVGELFQRWQRLGEMAGFPTSVEAEQLFMRRYWQQISAECQLTAEQRAALAAIDYTRFVTAFPEVKQALAALRTLGLRIGVLSNFALASLDRSLDGAGIAPWIDVACAATVIGVAKPNVTAYRVVTQALQMESAECVFFDDEPANVEGGRMAGLHSFLVDRRRSTHAIGEGVICDLTGVAPALSFIATQAAA